MRRMVKENLVTMRHLDNMCKVMLATSMIVGYSYAVEFFTAFFSGNPYERFVFVNRAIGPPWNIWSDQRDSLSQRDTGWIQVYVENGQEALDMIIQLTP
jgi:pyruvate/2-oxoacid:ferredoxin oxidoreductase alpha subunit